MHDSALGLPGKGAQAFSPPALRPPFALRNNREDTLKVEPQGKLLYTVKFFLVKGVGLIGQHWARTFGEVG